MSTERTSERVLREPPPPPSTKKTLVFPAVEIARARFVPPPPPRLRNLTRSPSTRPGLAPSSSDTGVIELSASALEEILEEDADETPILARVAEWPRKTIGRVADAFRERAARRDASSNARALERSIAAFSVPPPGRAAEGPSSRERSLGDVLGIPLPPAKTTARVVAGSGHVFEDAWGAAAIAELPRIVLGAAFVRGTLGPIAFAVLAGALVEGSVAPAEAARPEPRAAAVVRTTLAHPRPGAVEDAPASSCTALGPAKSLAAHAQLGPGVDVRVLDDGFGLGFAATASDAEALRVAGPWLRVEERVLQRGAWGVRHVAPSDDDDALALRIDADDARTVVSAGGAPLRVSASGGILGATRADGRLHVLWALPPGGPMMPAWSGFSRVASGPGRSAPSSARTRIARVPMIPAPEVVRAAARSGSGVVVALKRPAALWVGVAGADLEPKGPLVAIERKGATLGTPSVAAAREGAIVAWSERAAGASEWSVVVAGVADGAVTTRVVGAGMSPSVVALPDGDLLVAYAIGASGAHRVVAQRLAPGLEPRGEPLPVSPVDLNAGQPAAAVGPDGRGVVAFFVADARDRGALHATPLACAVR